MKSEKGITLISLTVYVIAMIIVVAIVSVISSYFYKNVTGTSEASDPYKQYTKLNSFFSEEANKKNIKVIEYAKNYIVFDNNVQYEFIKENKGIYRNNVKICNNIDKCEFSVEIKNGKNIINVVFESGNFKNSSTTYTLKD